MKTKDIKILLVDDEPDILEIVSYNLSAEGYEVFTAKNGIEAVAKAKKKAPHLIILDVMMPEMDGIEACEQIRNTPGLENTIITFLTARGEDYSQVAGFDAGADDYITKPFSTRELIARIRAVLRRTSAAAAEKAIQVEGLCLDPVSHRITANDSPVDMGPTEYRLLEFFMSHQERADSRTQLLDQVWGANVYVEDRTIDVHIRRLRKALEPFGFDRFIQTVRGTGYRFSTKTAQAS